VKRLLVALVTASLLSIVATAAPPANNEVIPLIEMQDVRLPDAIRQLASKGRLNVILDPRLTAPPFNQMTVSVRWESVTAKEALAALLDNYDLVMVETAKGPSLSEGRASSSP
jgi:hypothetical protein